MINFEEKMKLFKNNKVINWHEHVWPDRTGELDLKFCDNLVEAAQKTYTDKLICSLPITRGNPTPEEVSRYNDLLHMAMKRHPGVIKGFAYVNPGYVKESLYEIDRCVNDLGMIGVKIYNQYFISDPILHSLVEKCIELDIPILEHAGKLNYRPDDQPFISNGVHFVPVSKRYPEAVIIMAHIGGGGDWQWSLKAIEDCPNIYTDTSGSICDERLIEETVRYLGAGRILFGTDGSYSPGVGKMLGAKISEQDKITILNNPRFEKYLERGL